MDKAEKLFTHHAPAEKAPRKILIKQNNHFANSSLLENVLNAVPDIVLVLNKERQIVYSNKSLVNSVGEDNMDIILGMRLGEVLNCSHAFDINGGCGTTEFCKTCGAINSILASQQGKFDVQECRIIQKDSLDALDLRVLSTPLELDGEQFTIFAIQDISNEKRRKALERIFFHDILNTAGVINGISNLLITNDAVELEKYIGMLKKVSRNLIEEITGHRILTSAENKELTVRPSIFQSKKLLNELVDNYRMLTLAEGKTILIDERSIDLTCYNDKTLIERVIGNMLKNALEVVGEDGTVKVGCEKYDNFVKYWVHNPGFIPRDIQLQIFQRSFSTKGDDRGLGTYSIKLLTEKYLKGKVSFTSSKQNGTSFKAYFPME